MQHTLTDINYDTKQGTCAVCGSVKLWGRGTRKDGKPALVCSMRAKASGNTPAARLAHKRAVWRHRGIRITESQLEAHLNAENCACCNASKVDTKLYLDHSHATGNARGSLCHQCNVALGQVDDDIRILESMIRYLSQ